MGRVAWIPQDRDARDRRDRLFEELDVFCAHLDQHASRARQVAARTSEARHEPAGHRVADGYEDDWNRPGRVLGRDSRRRRERHNEIDLKPDEFGRQLRQLPESAFRPSVLESDVPTLDMAELAQALPEKLEGGRRVGPE